MAILQTHAIELPGKQSVQTYFMERSDLKKDAPVIFWVHGIGAYGMRDEKAMRYFADLGYNSIAFDLPGHGKSGGISGDIYSLDTCLQAIDQIYRFYKDKLGKKIFLVGHSLGGMLSLLYTQWSERTMPVYKTVVMAPALAMDPVKVPWYKHLFIAMMGWVWPTYRVKLVRDGEQGDALLLDTVTMRSFYEMRRGGNIVVSGATERTVPVYILAAGDEKMAYLPRMKEYYQLLPKNLEKGFVEFPGMRHYLLGEPDAQKVLEKIAEIIAQP